MATLPGGLPDLTRSDHQTASGPEVYIETFGCQMNVYDSQAIGGLLKRDGFRLLKDDIGADARRFAYRYGNR